MSWNTERIAEQLRAGVARVLRDDVTDPRVSMGVVFKRDRYLSPAARSFLDTLECRFDEPQGTARRRQ